MGRQRGLLLQPLVDKKQQRMAKKVKERGSQKPAKRTTSNQGRRQMQVRAIIRRRASTGQPQRILQELRQSMVRQAGPQERFREAKAGRSQSAPPGSLQRDLVEQSHQRRGWRQPYQKRVPSCQEEQEKEG